MRPLPSIGGAYFLQRICGPRYEADILENRDVLAVRCHIQSQTPRAQVVFEMR